MVFDMLRIIIAASLWRGSGEGIRHLAGVQGFTVRVMLLFCSGNVLTILWNDLTIKGNDLAWNHLTMERSDRMPSQTNFWLHVGL